MQRSEWIKERRREAEGRYSTRWAPQYSEKWGVYDNSSHQAFIQKFLVLVPLPSTILDAACGAGRYMPMLLEKGHTVIGIDEAEGMLARAKEKFPMVHTEKLGLQDMEYAERFEGAICMDALEHVCPEDWPLIFHNFHRALKADGVLYFTVELASDEDLETVFRQAQQRGLPVVYGEWPDNDEVYHYYPAVDQVRQWLQENRFTLVEEGEGDGYHHFIARKA